VLICLLCNGLLYFFPDVCTLHLYEHTNNQIIICISYLKHWFDFRSSIVTLLIVLITMMSLSLHQSLLLMHTSIVIVETYYNYFFCNYLLLYLRHRFPYCPSTGRFPFLIFFTFIMSYRPIVCFIAANRFLLSSDHLQDLRYPHHSAIISIHVYYRDAHVVVFSYHKGFRTGCSGQRPGSGLESSEETGN
jgi:hypothetical protein